MAGGPGAEPVAGVRGQRLLKLRAFCNFKGQGNTIFKLKINVLKRQGLWRFPPFFSEIGTSKKKKKKKK